MRDITTLTMNPAIDLFVTVDQVIADEKLRCRDLRRDPGGGGINVARAVGRLGGSARAVYPAGTSGGALLTGLLEREGVVAVAIEVDGPVRENLTVYEVESGRQFRFIMPGSVLGQAAQRRLLEIVLDPPPAYLVASGSLPPDVAPAFYAELAGRAREAGARLVLDSSEEALRQGLKAGVFLVKPNRRELSQIAGRELREGQEQEEVARRLVERGEAEVVVVSLGAGGVLVVTGSGAERIASPDVPIQSRVGAGDSMVAGMTLALARGEDIVTAVRFGVAAGAAAVMTPGTELCRREDTERLFRAMLR
jgi:6-phosphofructokinase 2